MVTNIQYPHVLLSNDGSNNWTQISICCDHPNSKGEKQLLADGTFYQFQSIVFAPKNPETKNLLVGQEIKVFGTTGETRLKQAIKRVSIDEFHVRIWI